MAVATAARTLTMAQAVAEAIGQEMERDPNVFVMGEDVGIYGGIFGATSGPAQALRPGARHGYPDLRVGLHRRRHRRRGRRHAPHRRADVRRLLRRVHGPDLQPPGQEHVHVGGQRPAAGGGDDGDRRRLQRRRSALAEPLRDLRPRARAQGRRPVQRVRRQGAHDRGDPRRQPRDVLLPQGNHGAAVDGVLRGQHHAGAGGELHGTLRPGARRPRRQGPDPRHPEPDGAQGSDRGRRNWASRASTSRSSTSARSSLSTSRRWSAR